MEDNSICINGIKVIPFNYNLHICLDSKQCISKNYEENYKFHS